MLLLVVVLLLLVLLLLLLLKLLLLFLLLLLLLVTAVQQIPRFGGCQALKTLALPTNSDLDGGAAGGGVLWGSFAKTQNCV